VGKTAICAGLGKHLLNDGKKVGFLKPIVTDDRNLPKEGSDGDALFMKRVFALEEPVGYLCPVITKQGDPTSSIRDAYARVSQGKDVVIVEGVCGLGSEGMIAEALGAKVIIVEGYSSLLPQTALANSYQGFGNLLLGVVLNKVPERRLEPVREEATARFGKAGIKVLGVIPENRVLFTLTIAELSEHLQGEILNSAENSKELVENFMLGAKPVDPGPEYFSRRTNKAVVLRSERPDMQLAALETSIRCLVISGNTPPVHTVRYGAEVKRVPIILTELDITSIVDGIEGALDKARFNQEEKLPKLTEIMGRHFAFQALYRGLGLAS